jgi:signal transduction histidine kinase
LEAVGPSGAAGFVLLAYAADVLVAHAVELAASQGELGVLIEQIDTRGLIPRASLARAVLRAPELLQLPAAVAIEVQLALLVAFVNSNAVSLWTLRGGDEIRHIAHGGDFEPTADRARRLARRLLSGGGGRADRTRGLSGAVIDRGHRPAVALVVSGAEVTAASRKSILEGATPMIRAVLERDELLSGGSRSRAVVVAAAERRLSRLRFDLHDGPQQDVVLLADDLGLLRTQLEGLMQTHREKVRVLGRLDDLQARLVAIDGDLRRISAFVQSPFLRAEAFPEALAKLTDEFAARTGLQPKTKLEGDFSELTDSQQITLLGLIREALSNIREHSDAKKVTIALSAGSEGVEATVSDDGQGFDPETTLVQAARGGHLGLVGMHERVQLLGGHTKIESRPGGPTVISARLPRYVTAMADAQVPLGDRSENAPPRAIRPTRARSRAGT